MFPFTAVQACAVVRLRSCNTEEVIKMLKCGISLLYLHKITVIVIYKHPGTAAHNLLQEKKNTKTKISAE